VSTATLPRDLALRAAWSHGAGKELVADPGQPATHPRPDADGPQLLDLWPRESADRVARAVVAALTPTRWDDWSGYNAHRPFPSARAKQAHSVHVRAGGVLARVDEVRGALGDHRAVAPSPAAVLVRAEPLALPAGYGPIRFAIATLEAGHVAGALLERLAEQGLAVTQRLDLSDPGRPGLWLTPGDRPGGTPVVPALWARRCSGLDPRGLAPDPRPLPRSTWMRLLAAAPVSGNGLRHRLSVHRVAGVADGVWEATAGEPTLVHASDVQSVVARAFRAPPDAARVAAMNVVWGISAPLASGGDPQAYPATLFAAGIAAQQVCRAAAAAGLFARPIRGVDEPDVEAALRVPADEDLVYTLLIGRPRVHGFTYDLSPVTAYPLGQAGVEDDRRTEFPTHHKESPS